MFRIKTPKALPLFAAHLSLTLVCGTFGSLRLCPSPRPLGSKSRLVMSGLTSYLLSLYALKFCKWASNEESNLTLLQNFVANLLCGLWVLACDKFTPEVNICVKCSCYVTEVKMKLTEKPNTGLTVSWNAGGYGPNCLEKEITRFHFGEHIPSSFSIGYLLGKKILICSSCSLIGKKNFTSVNLLQLLAFLGRSPELPDRVS